MEHDALPVRVSGTIGAFATIWLVICVISPKAMEFTLTTIFKLLF